MYSEFPNVLRDKIERHSLKVILDVGGGAEPMLPVEYVVTNGLDYTVLDVSSDELALAPREYHKVLTDMAAPRVSFPKAYDFVFSRFVAEHVTDARQFHANVFKALRPGGLVMHFFPTMFALPFLVNKLVPERLGAYLLPRYRRQRGKFPAYYRWCVGPSSKAVARLQAMGYEVLEYSGFFGHGYYDRMPLMREVQGMVKEYLVKNPVSYFTSFAWVVLRRPLCSS